MIEKAGIYPELSETYHTEQHTPTECLTQTKIKTILTKTPYDLKYGVRKSTREMDIGSAAHALALGKGKEIVLSPYAEFRTNESKAWRDQCLQQGKIVLKEKEYEGATKIAQKIRDKIFTEIGEYDRMTEVPFYWREDDVWCGGCMDIWLQDQAIIIDPKITTAVHTPTRQIINMGWDIQAAWYKRGIEKIFPELSGKVRFFNLLISPEEPYTSRMVEISQGWLHARNLDCDRALKVWKECLATNEWPEYAGIETLNMPEWALREHLDQELEEENA